jgi:hypothetical protein
VIVVAVRQDDPPKLLARDSERFERGTNRRPAPRWTGVDESAAVAVANHIGIADPEWQQRDTGRDVDKVHDPTVAGSG